MPPADPKLQDVRPAPEAPEAANPRPFEPLPRRPRKRVVFMILAGLALLVAASWFAVDLWRTRGDESTDDAQVEADVVGIAPRVAGPISRVFVTDDTRVKAGDPIFEIDPTDYQVRVRQAEAELQTARAQAVAADAQVAAARATVSRAEAESEQAALDLRRAEELSKGDAIASNQLEARRTQSATARAGAGANRAQYAAALANANLARARVQAAQAAVDLTKLQLGYTTVRAPADGVVSRLAARVGGIVQPGQTLAQLVPARTYVVANFKETQTGAIRPGQPAEVKVDAYPDRKLEARVESVSGGTGARFALLPPDNASGNFVKVVQRVPVRVELVSPPADLPLRAGLSADVTVHTRDGWTR